MQDRLFIRMLTGGDLAADAPVAIDWRGRNARALMAALALRPGEAVPRDWLADLLWPESGQQAARSNLRMALMTLRRALEPLGGELIVATGETIALALPREAVDAARFQDLAARPDLEARREALALYRGDLLAGMSGLAETFDAELRQLREHLRALAVETGLALAAVEPSAQARAAFRRVLAIDPACEPAHRGLIAMALAEGDRAGALHQFERCREALAAAYDIAPSDATRALLDRPEAAPPAEEAPVRATSEPPPPVGAPPAPATGLAPEPRPAPGRAWRRRQLPWIVLASIAGVAAALAGYLSVKLREPRGEVSILLPPVRASRCAETELPQRVRDRLAAELLAVDGISVIGSPGAAGSGVQHALLLDAGLLCDGDLVWLSLTLKTATTGDIRSSADEVGTAAEIEALVRRMVAQDLAPEIRRGTGAP